MKSTDKKLIVGLEVGTSKVLALVGEVHSDGVVNIIGVGQCQSKGVDKGGVNDLESVVKSIQRAIDQAELMADCQISSVYLALSGKHIKCQNEIGIVPISEEEVTAEDVENVIHTAKSVRILDDHRILHVIPQEFSIDLQEGIRNPIGLSGVRMQSKVHLITCHNDMARNLVKAVEKCNLHVDQLIFSGLASSYAVLTADEKELGVCLIDIGGGTMDISVFTGGSLRYSSVIPYAGNVVTSDIAYAFGTPPTDAEIIKIKYGCADKDLVDHNEVIDVPSVGGRPSRTLERHTLTGIIEPRYVELLTLVQKELKELQINLKKQNVKHQIAAGIVLTGGASEIKGIVECAEKVFNNQVRVGLPLNVSGLTDYVKKTMSATAVGLLQYGKDEIFSGGLDIKKSSIRGISKWIASWFKKEF